MANQFMNNRICKCRGVIDFSDSPSMAEPQHKNECDINRIMAKFRVTGQLPVTQKAPQYGDFTSVGDATETHIRADDLAARLESLSPDLRAEIARAGGVDRWLSLSPDNVKRLDSDSLSRQADPPAQEPPKEDPAK